MSGEFDSPMAGARDAVKRAMMLVDRENDRGAGVVFCQTEEELRRVHQAMNEMSHLPNAGTRTSVEVYEVAVDGQPSSYGVQQSAAGTAGRVGAPVKVRLSDALDRARE